MAKIEILKCHCSSIELELTLPNGFENLRKCSCSICSNRNAVVASVSINYLKVVKGETKLREYTFNTHAAKHSSNKISLVFGNLECGLVVRRSMSKSITI